MKRSHSICLDGDRLLDLSQPAGEAAGAFQLNTANTAAAAAAHEMHMDLDCPSCVSPIKQRAGKRACGSGGVGERLSDGGVRAFIDALSATAPPPHQHRIDARVWACFAELNRLLQGPRANIGRE